ncbi:hypothetical protein ACIQUY_04825 [Streptomyces sp. NPDC090231]|uniref:hypothetical protein n=1 Tax=unclassified Streptomyces TaxID=2593676 RepID=UPI00381A2F7C
MSDSAAGARLFALIASIPGSGTVEWCDEARKLLEEVRTEHAHELAERIRTAFDDAFEASQEVLSGVDAMLAADLIDPEVKT